MFPILEQEYAVGKLLDGWECQILLDTGSSKSFMSKSHYSRCKSLHLLPKFASETHRIKVGNGQYVSVLFIIPIVTDIHGHRCEILCGYQIITILSKGTSHIKTKRAKIYKNRSPFIDEISELTMVKMLDKRHRTQ